MTSEPNIIIGLQRARKIFGKHNSLFNQQEVDKLLEEIEE